jgi:hypothetical protein
MRKSVEKNIKLSLNDCFELFNSSNCLLRLNNFYFQSFIDIVNKGIVLASKETIPVLSLKGYRKHYLNRGSEKHNYICGIMAKADILLWNGTPEHEVWVGNKRVDIFDEKNNIVMEIGDTNPDDVWMHLAYCNAVLVVPFQEINKNIIAWKFTAKSKEEIDKYQKKEITDILTKIFGETSYESGNKNS